VSRRRITFLPQNAWSDIDVKGQHWSGLCLSRPSLRDELVDFKITWHKCFPSWDAVSHGRISFDRQRSKVKISQHLVFPGNPQNLQCAELDKVALSATFLVYLFSGNVFESKIKDHHCFFVHWPWTIGNANGNYLDYHQTRIEISLFNITLKKLINIKTYLIFKNKEHGKCHLQNV